MNRKTFSLLIAFVLVISLCGCVQTAESPGGYATPTLITPSTSPTPEPGPFTGLKFAVDPAKDELAVEVGLELLARLSKLGGEVVMSRMLLSSEASYADFDGASLIIRLQRASSAEAVSLFKPEPTATPDLTAEPDETPDGAEPEFVPPLAGAYAKAAGGEFAAESVLAAQFMLSGCCSSSGEKRLGLAFGEGESASPDVTLYVGCASVDAEGAELPFEGDADDIARGIVNGLKKYFEQLEYMSDGELSGEYAAVTARWPVTVYENEGLGLTVTTATDGQRLRVLGDAGALCEVQLCDSGETGFVLKRCAVDAGAPPTVDYTPDYGAPKLTVRIDGSLSVRLEGRSDAEKAERRLRDGDRVTLLGFEGVYAHVLYDGNIEGYVSASYLVFDGEQTWENDIETVTVAESYGYAALNEDIKALTARFPELISASTLGKSVNGRDIALLTVGNINAERRVFIQAAMHAREYTTSMLVMAELEWLCAKRAELLEDICFVVAPMSNPDGVEIVLSSEAAELIRPIYESDLAEGYTESEFAEYVRRWKANGAGVDLNRNFDSYFGEGSSLRDAPSAAVYAGKAPLDQPESRLLAEYITASEWDAVLHYHAYGSILYWNFRTAEANGESWDLASVIRAVTGYQLRDDTGVDGGGFKDYLQLIGYPSVTIEIGARDCPLPLDDFTTTWLRNRDLLPVLAEHLIYGK